MFGFNKVTHKSFRKNFLKTVIFQIGFDGKIFDNDKKNEIVNLFKNQFPRENKIGNRGFQVSFRDSQTPIVQPIRENEGVELKSEDGQKILTIDRTMLSLTVSGVVYRDYYSLKEDLTKIEDFLKLSNISELNRIAIRKINLVEFKLEDNANDVLSALINPNLTVNQNYFPNSEKITHNIHSLNYRDGDAFLNIKYGLNVPPNTNTKIGQILIDIDLYKLTKLESSAIFEASDEINSEIFNVFNWVLSNKTLSMLNG